MNDFNQIEKLVSPIVPNIIFTHLKLDLLKNRLTKSFYISLILDLDLDHTRPTKLWESMPIVYCIMKNFEIWQWETLKYFKWICSRFVTGQRTCQTAPSGRLSFWKEDSQRADKHLYKYTEIKLLNKFKIIVDNLCNGRILVEAIAT